MLGRKFGAHGKSALSVADVLDQNLLPVIPMTIVLLLLHELNRRSQIPKLSCDRFEQKDITAIVLGTRSY